MTPSKLKEQLMKRWDYCYCPEEEPEAMEFVAGLIAIICEQQQALNKAEAYLDESEPRSPFTGREAAALVAVTSALASTAEKLKALGCE